MKRRSFIYSAAAASVGIPVCSTAASADESNGQKARSDASFAVDGNRVRFFTNAVTKPIRVLIVADTHLFMDDKRGAPYQEFSGRMAAAYNKTTHFQTGKTTNPNECFERTLQLAQKRHVDLLALVGDIFSFPSEAAIEWVTGKLEESKVPYLYVAGNHDWHYAGMPGSLEQLSDLDRETFEASLPKSQPAYGRL